MSNISSFSYPNSFTLHFSKKQHPLNALTRNYKIIKELGIGASAIVYLVCRRIDTKLFAAKLIKKERIPLNSWKKHLKLGIIPNEVYILDQIKNDHIISLEEVFEDDYYFYLITCSFDESMDLFEYLQINPILPIQSIFKIFQQVSLAIKYLHSKNIVHLDIKDENILVNSSLEIKLLDFGSCHQFSNNCDMSLSRSFYKGSRNFAPPEVLDNSGNSRFIGKKVDLWCLGVLLYKLYYKEIPGQDFIIQSDSSPLSELLSGLLEVDVDKRWGLNQVFESRWYTSFT